MSYSLDGKIVIAITSSALFDMRESDHIFREKGLDAYEKYQKEHVDDPFDKGVAFPFISRLLKLNAFFPDNPIEVILLSKNSPQTGLRAFNSFRHYQLDITRAVLSSGEPNYLYLNAFGADLFLSSNDKDVKDALMLNFPAGKIIDNGSFEDDDNAQLRIAFDFDGVLSDDESERIFKYNGVEEYRKYEMDKEAEPLNPGPLEPLLKKISKLQKAEKEMREKDSTYIPQIKTSIVTARNAPAHERMINTLNSWGIEVDWLFLLGGLEKDKILSILRPHIFFDDQLVHLENIHAPAVHIPYGVANKVE